MKTAVLAAFAAAMTAGAEAATIGYWPMNVTASGSKRTVKDVSGNGYDFSVRAESVGGSVFVENDIGWTLPPNPDPAVGDAESLQMLQSDDEKSASSFDPVLTQTTAIRDKMSYENDFTMEGWFRATEHPDPTDSTRNKFIFCFNSIGHAGGWMLYETVKTDASGAVTEYPFYLEYNCGGKRLSSAIATIAASSADMMKRWNHYAVVCATKDASNRQFRLYLNGRLMGRMDVATTEPAAKGGAFNISGAGSSGNKQAMVGDLTCWRASDEALAPEQFLCGLSRTVAYWPMVADGQKVNSPLTPLATLTTRDPSLGGISSSENDIGWTLPPNPDPETDEGDPAWLSTMKMTVAKDTNPSYTAAFRAEGVYGLYLGEAICPTHSFTVEGWFRPSELPADSSANHMFAYNTLGQYGGWCWNLYGPDDKGQCAVKLQVAQRKDSPSSRSNIAVASVGKDELLNRWCHYALAYDVTTRKWSFYLNGMLRGTSAAGADLSDVAYSSSVTYFFGCGSGTAQIPTGDVSTWRISHGVLSPDEMLCGAGAFVWAGTEDDVWTTEPKANWKINGKGDALAWADACPAKIDDSSTTTEITFGSMVNPKSLAVDIDRDVKIVATGSGANTRAIGSGCEEITKTGKGTLWFYGREGNINASANDVRIKEGTIRVTNPNYMCSLGNGGSAAGYSVFVHDGGRLWTDQRNSLGRAGLTDSNNVRVTVYTNGVFDMTFAEMDGNTFNIQTVSTLDLLGGKLVMPTVGHSSGCFMVRDRITFGKNPNREPYVFNPSQPFSRNNPLAWQLGVNPEYRVEDITEDAEPDVTFNCHLLAKTAYETDAKKPTPCGFRKTGDGTMVLAQRGTCSSELRLPSNGVAVEEGELRVDGDYEAAFAVSSGAFLSGTGTVASVTFAPGAGIRGVIGQAAPLTVTGDCALGASGAVEIRNPAAGRRRAVRLLRVNGTLTGGENLANWTLTLDGKPTDEAVLALRGNDIVVKSTSGLTVLVR